MTRETNAAELARRIIALRRARETAKGLLFRTCSEYMAAQYLARIKRLDRNIARSVIELQKLGA